MFNRLFKKGNPPSPPKDAVDSSGLEVVEDDPDTAWSRWDEALALQDAERRGLEVNAGPLPTIAGQGTGSVGYADEPTQPMGLEDLTPEQRKNRALHVVELHHRRVANTIRTLWGYKECSLYINKLIMNGEDGKGHARAGFNHEAVEAMLALTNLHDELFGAFDPHEGTGFGDLSVRTGWDGLR
ncbi:MAG: hypothetical protein KGN32_16200 [Burkholderiales bacterium]|nr:hypothetical protein [Burkholderiales bacterium]